MTQLQDSNNPHYVGQCLSSDIHYVARVASVMSSSGCLTLYWQIFVTYTLYDSIIPVFNMSRFRFVPSPSILKQNTIQLFMSAQNVGFKK